MPFEEIKQTLIRALYLLPSSYDIGLRVFDDQVKGSTRIVEYTRNIDVIRGALEKIQPRSGTFIGASLIEATGDLLATPQGNNRLILITDGEGNDGDIAQALKARHLLQPLMGSFRCYFILFSTRKNVHSETPIGRIADILGCDLTTPQEGHSAPRLARTLQRILSVDISLIWLLLSFIGYMTLVAWTARLIFAIKLEQRMLARRARSIAVAFFLILLLAAVMTHFVGILGYFSPYMWLLMGGGTMLLMILWILDSLGVGARHRPRQIREYDDDPFR